MKTAGIIFGLDLLRTVYTGFNNIKQENEEESEQQIIIKNKHQSPSWKTWTGVGILFIGGVILVLSRKNRD